MSPAQFRTARELLGLSRDQLAKMVSALPCDRKRSRVIS
jgi:ribosome-binding protein aMBF1 (putative translation factor)